MFKTFTVSHSRNLFYDLQTEYQVGFFLGSTLILLLIVIFLSKSYWASPVAFARKEEIIVVFRALGLPVLLVWLWGLDMLIWERYRVNYAFIFDFDLLSHNGPSRMLLNAAQLSFIWILFLFFHLNSLTPIPGLEFLANVGPLIWPLLLVLIFLVLFIRSSILNHGWLLSVIGRCIIAPFTPVRFRDFFIADQLVSLAILFGDAFYVSCFYVHDAWNLNTTHDVCPGLFRYVSPLLAAFPLWIRVMQSIRRRIDQNDRRQVANAAKYATGMLVVISSTVRGFVGTSSIAALVVWILCAIGSSAYSFWWDVQRDWGLAHPKDRSHHFLLRDRLIYGRPLLYYWAILSDAVLRLGWTLTISPEFYSRYDPKLFQSVLSSIEIYRRGQWNIFRLENEQLNNVGLFRATNYVPPVLDPEHGLPPLPAPLPQGSPGHPSPEGRTALNTGGAPQVIVDPQPIIINGRLRHHFAPDYSLDD